MDDHAPPERKCKCLKSNGNDHFCVCYHRPPPLLPPATSLPPMSQAGNDKRSLISTSTIMVGSILSTIVFLGIFFVFVRFHFNRRNRRRNRTPFFFGTQRDFLDEDRGPDPVLDNPIWYINTVGLQQSVIDSITCFKYRKDEGIVDEVQCSVCLNEFEDEESLRLLPKCSHAFHLPCIDTWLRSHKSCPLCRAPVVNENVVEASGSAPIADHNSGRLNGTHIVEISENDVGTISNCPIEDGNGNSVVSVSDDDDVDTQHVRRSVSLDLSSAMEIYVDVRNGAEKQIENLNKGSRMQLKKTGSIGASLSKGPISMKRSFSCGGIFSLSKQTRSRNLVLPL